MATTPEQSDYTSVQARIHDPDNACLVPFSQQAGDCLPFKLKDYLELVDWGGRELRSNKPSHIPASVPPILVRLKMNASPVLKYLAKDEPPFQGALGSVTKLRAFAASIGKKFVKGHLLGDRLCPERA